MENTSGSSDSGGRPIRFAFSHAVDQIGAGDPTHLRHSLHREPSFAGSRSRFFCPPQRVRALLGKMTLQADILKEAKISPFSSSVQ